MSKDLVIIACGKGSCHPSWAGIGEVAPKFDLALCIYDQTEFTDPLSAGARYTIRERGLKFRILDLLLRAHPEILFEYEHTLLLDDDLDGSVGDLNRIFEDVRRFDFDLAQPSLTADSPHTYPATLQRTDCLYHRTNSVEIMCPVLNQWLLQATSMIIPTLSFGFGWGLEGIWEALLESESGTSKLGGIVGVLDTVALRHTRPVMGPDSSAYKIFGNPHAEMESLGRQYGTNWSSGRMIVIEERQR